MRIALNSYIENIINYYKNRPYVYEYKNTPLIYIIEITERGKTTKDDTKSIVQKLSRMKDKDSSIVYYVAESTTKSSSILYTKYIGEGRGRKKKVIVGEKVPYHLHIGVLSISDNSPRKAARELLEFIQKKRKLKSRVETRRSLYPIKYAFYQADSIHTSQNFNFNYFLNEFYDDVTALKMMSQEEEFQSNFSKETETDKKQISMQLSENTYITGDNSNILSEKADSEEDTIASCNNNIYIKDNNKFKKEIIGMDIKQTLKQSMYSDASFWHFLLNVRIYKIKPISIYVSGSDNYFLVEVVSVSPKDRPCSNQYYMNEKALDSFISDMTEEFEGIQVNMT